MSNARTLSSPFSPFAYFLTKGDLCVRKTVEKSGGEHGASDNPACSIGTIQHAYSHTISTDNLPVTGAVRFLGHPLLQSMVIIIPTSFLHSVTFPVPLSLPAILFLCRYAMMFAPSLVVSCNSPYLSLLCILSTILP